MRPPAFNRSRLDNAGHVFVVGGAIPAAEEASARAHAAAAGAVGHAGERWEAHFFPSFAYSIILLSDASMASSALPAIFVSLICCAALMAMPA